MKLTKFLVLSILLLGTSTSVNAQFWKKIKKKVQDKIEQKVEEKIDKETDKAIDKTLDGKKETETKEVETKLNKNKDYGDFTISHTTKFGSVTIDELGQTKIIKEGNSFKLSGSWWSHEADIHDGYVLLLNNGISIDEINKKGNFLIPSEATLKLSYDPTLPNKTKSKDGLSRAVTNNYQTYSVVKGSVTINIQKDKKVEFSFNGETELVTSVVENSNGNNIKTKANSMVLGTFKTVNPQFFITKTINNKKKNNNNNSSISESDKAYIKEKLLPTVNIPSTFNFNKSIEVKMIDESSNDVQNIEFLTGKYPDIYGMSIASKEMKGQQMLIVTTPKSTSMFMNMAGMKIKKSMSLEQVSSQYNMAGNVPEEGDYSYKKTGNTKTIIGYLCEEVKVDYNYSDAKGSVSFWLSKDFPIQNKAIPMLGMKMNNANFSGFVLEMNSVQNGKKFTIQVVNVSDKNVSINTISYKSLGF